MTPISGLIKNFSNAYKLCNNDINKFILLLKEGVYHYEYMDSWERIYETMFPNKKAFCSELYDTTDEDYIHAQKVSEEFKIKKNLVSIIIYTFKVMHCCLQMYLKILEINVLK